MGTKQAHSTDSDGCLKIVCWLLEDIFISDGPVICEKWTSIAFSASTKKLTLTSWRAPAKHMSRTGRSVGLKSQLWNEHLILYINWMISWVIFRTTWVEFMCLLDEMMVLGQWEYLTHSTAISRWGEESWAGGGGWVAWPLVFSPLFFWLSFSESAATYRAVVPLAAAVWACAEWLSICWLCERRSSEPWPLCPQQIGSLWEQA